LLSWLPILATAIKIALKKSLNLSKTLTRTPAIKNNLLLINGDSLQVSIDGRFIMVAKKLVTGYDNVYNGIYQIHSDSITRKFSTEINGISYFTAYENVGMGYRGFLYAFDLERKKLLTSDSTKDDYVFSSGGMFFLNNRHLL
jgi:hypothetical protein